MKVILKRTGGFMGPSRQWELDERALAPAKAQELRRLLDQAGFFALPSEVGSVGRARDSFSYQLTIEDGHRKHTVKCAEPALPPPLRSCIGLIMGSAR